MGSTKGNIDFFYRYPPRSATFICSSAVAVCIEMHYGELNRILLRDFFGGMWAECVRLACNNIFLRLCVLHLCRVSYIAVHLYPKLCVYIVTIFVWVMVFKNKEKATLYKKVQRLCALFTAHCQRTSSGTHRGDSDRRDTCMWSVSYPAYADPHIYHVPLIYLVWNPRVISCF